ncbi:MAG: hypothetical protein AAF378_20940, partial [Cyanobacteria bacterium P01_A01_bin.84]
KKKYIKQQPFEIHRCRVLIDSECYTTEITNRLTPFLEESDIQLAEGKNLRKELKSGNSTIEIKTLNGIWQIKSIGKRKGRYLWDLYFLSSYCFLI